MGISTDTGHFKRGKDLSVTFTTVAYLLNLGADLSFLVNQLYRNNDFAGIRYVGQLLQDMQQDEGIIWCAVDAAALQHRKLDEAKIESLLSLMTSISHQGIYMLFKYYEQTEKNYLKCSLRTKNSAIDLSKIATHFG
jgi:nanoRNase/pAp phosphatase (c-di-AMP/oligoRNAs hydrolase)